MATVQTFGKTFQTDMSPSSTHTFAWLAFELLHTDLVRIGMIMDESSMSSPAQIYVRKLRKEYPEGVTVYWFETKAGSAYLFWCEEADDA